MVLVVVEVEEDEDLAADRTAEIVMTEVAGVTEAPAVMTETMETDMPVVSETKERLPRTPTKS